MKYTLTKRDVGILLGFLGIVIAGLTYYFIYIGYKDKTTELVAANAAMQERVDVLQDLVNRQSELVADTQKNNKEAEELMDRFPADYRYEDALLFGIELNELSPFEEFPAIAFTDPESVYAFEDVTAAASEQVRGYIPAGVVEAAPVEGEDGEALDEEVPVAESAPTNALPELIKKGTSYTCTTDYAGLKNALAYVLDSTDRCGLNITTVYSNETGLLTNVLDVIPYYVINTDKVYEAPEIPVVVKGTDDIFNALSTGRSSNRLNMGEGQITNDNTEESQNSEED